MGTILRGVASFNRKHNMAEIGDDSVELLKDDAQIDDEKDEPGIWTMDLLSH